jgi:predicted dehydrogenase
MYKCAIIAVGGSRAKGHAEAYQHIGRGQLVAASTRNKEKLGDFGKRFQIKSLYTDYREMMAKERPDLIHVNTPPDVRLEIIKAAQEAKIPALIIEKPLAMQGEDYAAIEDYVRWTRKQKWRTKIGINHQLHFHPRRQVLQNLVQEGKIGALRFVEASSGMNLAYQGTHSLQAIGAFLPGSRPVSVFGQASGAAGLADTPKKHFAPDESLLSIKYDKGIDAVLRCGANAPRVKEGPIHQHKRIAVYGSRGHASWTMWSWETLIDGRLEQGGHEYPEEDILGQARMTEAMFDWLEDDLKVHPLNIDGALVDFNTILGLYTSVIHRKVIALPVVPEDDLIAKLRTALNRDSGL